MKEDNRWVYLFALIGIPVLILDGKTAITGMRMGIEICLQTLIPSLFPFFVLIGFITCAIAVQAIPIFEPIGKICKIPRGFESLLLCGFIGGYPVGARNVAQAYAQGKLSLDQAQRLAILCNNTGPSFIFGILGSLFPDLAWVCALWLVQILSVLLTGILLPSPGNSTPVTWDKTATNLTETLPQAIRSIAVVCGWVVLFRMVLEFANRWFLYFLPILVRVALTGALELTNGCLKLDMVDILSTRFLMATWMLSTGGLCVVMQTKAVFPQLNFRRYLFGKGLQTVIAMVLAWSWLVFLNLKLGWVPTVLMVIFFPVYSFHFCRKRKIAVAFPGVLMYNTPDIVMRGVRNAVSQEN